MVPGFVNLKLVDSELEGKEIEVYGDVNEQLSRREESDCVESETTRIGNTNSCDWSHCKAMLTCRQSLCSKELIQTPENYFVGWRF